MRKIYCDRCGKEIHTDEEYYYNTHRDRVAGNHEGMVSVIKKDNEDDDLYSTPLDLCFACQAAYDDMTENFMEYIDK